MDETKYSNRLRSAMLRYIEASLDLQSEISRKEICSKFGVSETFASDLLREYRKVNRLITNNFGMTYQKTHTFKRVLLTSEISSLQYLNDIDLLYGPFN